MDFKGKKILVAGLGKTGQAVALKLTEIGADVICVDPADNPLLKKEKQELESQGIKVYLGESNVNILDGVDFLIASPGIPYYEPLFQKALASNVEVLSEIELAYRLIGPKKTIAVSGTNGKTTTVSLLEAIFKESGQPFRLAGNIGSPLISEVGRLTTESLILELSSFQLHFISQFKAEIAVLLNISQDHIDWHSSFEAYVNDKKRLFLNQNKKDFALLNYDDPVVKGFSKEINSTCVFYSSRQFLNEGFCLEGGFLNCNGEPFFDIKDLKLVGEHNISNCLAASCAANLSGILLETIAKVLKDFKGLPHRLEWVANLEGIDFYNDSKATNPDATIKALRAFQKPVILIAGGRNKGNDFSLLAKSIETKVKTLILCGEATEEIKKTIKNPLIIRETASLEEATKEAYEAANPGDKIVLSPATASFDLFKDYKERGNCFKNAVQKLKA